MKKSFLFISAIVFLVGGVAGAVNVAGAVTGTSNATLVLPADGSTYTLDVSSQFDSFIINPASFTFSLVNGSVVKLSSADKRLLNNSLNIPTTCGADNSTLLINSAASQNVTITPGAVCSLGSVTISINKTITHQIMDGLGSEPITPGFTRPGEPKKFIPDTVIKELYKVFHTDLGYSQSHFHIGIDEPVNDNADPLSFDWTKFMKGASYDDFLDYLSYGQSIGLHSWFTFGHLWATLLKQEWLLDNELSSKGNKYKLKRGMEEEYVENLLAQVLMYKKWGINVPYAGIYNEPVWSNNNGRSMTPEQMVAIVKRLGQRLSQEGLSTKIHAPEDLSLNHAMLYIKALLADPEARKYVGALSYHAYQEVYADQPADAILNTSGQGNPPPAGVALRTELKQLSKQYGIPVWMTEVSGTQGTPHKIALARANHIHDEFTIADLSLFITEDFINYKYEGQGEPVDELIGVALDSAGNYKSHKIMKGGYMMSQYANFVRPGDVRIDAQSSDKQVRVTAFENPATGEIKIVAINNKISAVQAKIDITGAGQILTVLDGLRTSGDENWAKVTSSVIGNVLTLILAPESITSLRIKPILSSNTTPPTVSLIAPLPNTTVSGTTATVSATASEVTITPAPPSTVAPAPPSGKTTTTASPRSNIASLAVNTRIRVAENIAVRFAPAGERIGAKPVGARGIIREGPVTRGDYRWWKVDYDTGRDGWSAGPWLKAL